MRLKTLLSLLIISLFAQLLQAEQAGEIINTKIEFYSVKLDLKYHPSILEKNKHCTSTICLKRFYKKLENSNYQVLLESLVKHKEQMELNDWFFYNLVRKSVETIFDKKSDMFKTSFTWFLMTKAGYDTRLYTSKSKYTFLYIRTEDKVFEAPFVKIKNRPYVNLTSMYYGIKTKGILFEIPKFQPGQLNEKPFSFKIEKFPELPPVSENRNYQFEMDGIKISLDVEVDIVGNDLLKGFPITMPINYIKVPIANTTLHSLKSALAPHLADKSPSEKVRTLVNFTRKSFPYKNDQIRFQKDKPLTANQLMIADSSDFEDRCALFYNLLKETTNLNFIVIQYIHDDIITIGVELPEVTGKPFVYEGIEYTICDPTMPTNSSKLGLYPINLDKDIEILEVVRNSSPKQG